VVTEISKKYAVSIFLREIPQPEVGNSRSLWRALGSCLWVTGQEAFILFIYHESCKSSFETLETTLRTSWCHYPEGNILDVVVVHIFYMIFLGLLNWERWDGRDEGVNENCIEYFGQKTYDTWRFVFDRHRNCIVYEACLFQEFLVHICSSSKDYLTL